MTTDEQRISEFTYELHQMYRAGREQIPDKVAELDALVPVVEHHTAMMEQAMSESDAPGLWEAATLSDAVYQAMRATVITLNRAALGLVSAADAFAKVDDDTRAAMSQLRKDLKDSGDADLLHGRPATAPVPPAHPDLGSYESVQ